MSVKDYIPAIRYGNLVAGDEIEASAALTTPNIGAATGTSLTVTSNVVVKSDTAVPASAGAVAAGAPVTLFASGPSIYVTSDAPTFSAVKGSLCINTGGSSTSTRLYVNTNGSTTWTNVTTAA